jgi:16S rRNA (guanine966-N2)-methyltransferase
LVLDLFAGSGCLGIEALSRGAASALFVDADPASAGLIEKNISRLGLEDAAEVMRADVFAALRVLSREGLRFDIIILDPPYRKGLGERAVRAAAEKGIVAAGAIVAWEHSIKESLPDKIEPFGRPDTRRYGDSALTILESEAV